MDSSNLNRMMSYTRRVRHLTISGFQEHVSTHIYFSISRFCNHIMFPKLRTLRIPWLTNMHRDNHNALYLAPSPVLSSFYMGGIMQEVEVIAASVISQTLLEATSLNELHLSGKLSNLTLKLLAELPRLRILRLEMTNTWFTSDLLVECSNLKRLRTLEISLDDQSRITPLYISPVTFDYLQNFILKGSTGNICNLLSCLQFCCLDNLSLDFSSESTVPRIQTCISRCSKLGIIPSIISFRIAQLANPEVTPVSLETTISTIFRKNLTHLDIPVFYLTESVIRTCLQDCKNLEILKLSCHQVPPDGNGLSLYDLQIFADMFKKLKKLHVSLASLMENIGEKELLQKAIEDPWAWLGHNLEELVVLPISTIPLQLFYATYNYTYKEAIIASHYLDALFPRLINLSLPHVSDAWEDEVKALFKACQVARKRELLKAESDRRFCLRH